MRTLRLPLVRRLAAALALVAMAAPLVPTVGAQAGEAAALARVLDDAAAFETALAAAHAADADPLAAFAVAYEAATDGAVSADDVRRLLGAASMSGVAPVVADEAVASAGPQGAAGAATLHEPAGLRPRAVPAPAPAASALDAPPVRRATPARPRAP